MTEPLDDARGELLALARSLRSRRIMCDGGNGNVYDIADDECERAADLIEGIARPVPLPQCEAGPKTVSDEDWQRALDCALSCTNRISRAELDNAMQHAFGMLSLARAAPARCDAVNATPQRNAAWEAKIVADDLIGIQEDLEDETRRDTLGMAAHYLRQFAALVPPSLRGR